MNHVVVLATLPMDFVVHIDDAADDTPLQEDDRTCDYSAAEAPGNDDDDFEDGDGATVSSSDEDDTATSTTLPGMHCLAGSAFQTTEDRGGHQPHSPSDVVRWGPMW